MSADEPFADQEEADPQSWNLYSYVRNNPLRYIDPSGLGYVDAYGRWVGSKEGEYDKDLKATWRVDKNHIAGGFWDFDGAKPTVDIEWTSTDEANAELQAALNQQQANRESDDDCDDCFVEWGVSGRVVVKGITQVFRGTPSGIMDKNLKAAGIMRVVNTAAHHVVAHGSKKARVARKILKRFGVDINSSSNGVYLPKNLASSGEGAVHSTLHTNRYYDEVNRVLRSAETREQAVEILNYIKSELVKGTFPH